MFARNTYRGVSKLRHFARTVFYRIIATFPYVIATHRAVVSTFHFPFVFAARIVSDSARRLREAACPLFLGEMVEPANRGDKCSSATRRRRERRRV